MTPWTASRLLYSWNSPDKNARYWMLGAGALGRPRGMVRGGRREEDSGWGTPVYRKLYTRKVGLMAICSMNALETNRVLRLSIYASVCILLTKIPTPKEVIGCKVRGGRLVYP